MQTINKGIDPPLFERINKVNDDCPFHNLIDLKLLSLSPGEAVMTTPVRECHINPQNIAHGGVAFSLADTVMGMAIRTMGVRGVTIDINIHYLKPAVLGDTMIAYGNVSKMGDRIIVADAKMVNQNDEPIAMTRGTYYNKGPF